MLDRMLQQPESAHPQPRRAEARVQVIMRGIWSSYLALLFLTLVFQLFVRLQACEGFTPCATGLAKAVCWSLVWPFYWIFYLNG